MTQKCVNGVMVDMTPEQISARSADVTAMAGKLAARKAELARWLAYKADAARAELDQQLRTVAPADLETFVRGKVNAAAVTDAASQLAFNKRVEAAIVTIAKMLVRK